MGDQSGIDLEAIVGKPTWKQLLLELIVSERLDPWNIDIVKISDGFLKKVREMKKLDLLIPANIILASAILLRYKSDYLKLYEPQPEVMAYSEEGESEPEQIPVLTITSRIPPKRQITLDELALELENALKYEGTVYTPKHKGGIDEIMNFRLTGDDIEKTMKDMHEKLASQMDENRWVLFSNLTKDHKPIDTVYALLSILHLTQKNKVELHQEEIFGEILIYVNENGKKRKVDASQSEDTSRSDQPEEMVEVTEKKN